MFFSIVLSLAFLSNNCAQAADLTTSKAAFYVKKMCANLKATTYSGLSKTKALLYRGKTKVAQPGDYIITRGMAVKTVVAAGALYGIARGLQKLRK